MVTKELGLPHMVTNREQRSFASEFWMWMGGGLVSLNSRTCSLGRHEFWNHVQCGA